MKIGLRKTNMVLGISCLILIASVVHGSETTYRFSGWIFFNPFLAQHQIGLIMSKDKGIHKRWIADLEARGQALWINPKRIVVITDISPLRGPHPYDAAVICKIRPLKGKSFEGWVSDTSLGEIKSASTLEKEKREKEEMDKLFKELDEEGEYWNKRVNH